MWFDAICYSAAPTSTCESFASHWPFCCCETAFATAVAVDARTAVETVAVLETAAAAAAAAAAEADRASYFGFAFVEPETTASVEVCGTVVKAAACDSVASVEDSASEYFEACETERVAAACETEVTAAACDSAEEVAGFASVYFEACETAVYVAAEEAAVYEEVDASDEY